jgi:hypothetical protein
MSGHETILVLERYDALSVFEVVNNALPPRLRDDFDKAWRQPVTNDARALRNALQDMLEGPFRAADQAMRTKPVLLIIDDLGSILEAPKSEVVTPVKGAYNVVLASVIAAFRDATHTESRLLLTSPCRFALADGRGDDLAARLISVPLLPMDQTQRDKQIRAPKFQTAHGSERGAAQAVVSSPLLADETEQSTFAGRAVERYSKSDDAPKKPPPLGPLKQYPTSHSVGTGPGREHFIQLRKDLSAFKQLQELLPVNVYEDITRSMAFDILKKLGYGS